MAGIASVRTTIVNAIAAAIGMPNGYVPNTQATASALGLTMRLFPGWPMANLLDAEILAGAGQISVYPGANMARLTTRYLSAITDAPGVPTLVATISGQTVTFSGTPSAAHLVGIATGRGLALASYAYRVLNTDTLTTIAAAMASRISGASSVGAVLTVTQPIAFARVSADGTTAAETRRVEQAFRIGLWMPTPDARDLAGDVLDAGLAALPFLTTATNEAVRLKYTGSQFFDAPSKSLIWRTDMNFIAEYPTTQTASAAVSLFGLDNITGGAGATLALVA